MVGWATLEKTGAAIGFLLNDGKTSGDGRSAVGIGGAEDRDSGEANGSSDVHGAGIVTEEKMALGEESGEISNGGFAGEVDGLAGHACDDGAGDGKFARSAEEDDIGVAFGEETIGKVGEAIRWPAFGGAVGSARANGEAEHVGTSASGEQEIIGGKFLRIGHLQGDVIYLGESVEPTGATQQFKVIKLFVGGDFTGLGNGDGIGKEKAAAVACVADALRDLRAPGKPCGVEGVLEKKSNIEFPGAKLPSKLIAATHTFVNATRIVGDEFVADDLIAVNVGNIGTRNDGNGRLREFLTNDAKSWEGHDGVADPVRGANHDIHDLACQAGIRW